MMENENLAVVFQTLYNTNENRKEAAAKPVSSRRRVNAHPYNRNKAINLARAQG
jgi:hypothetical protein